MRSTTNVIDLTKRKKMGIKLLCGDCEEKIWKSSLMSSTLELRFNTRPRKNKPFWGGGDMSILRYFHYHAE